jgi:MoxR-like ATPase
LDARSIYLEIEDEMKKHISGKKETIELLFIAIVANGHALLEGVPGVAKTTMTKALANIIDADFKRIQGTPDLEPRDIEGYNYVDIDNIIKFKQGPVFTNILLVDELNRAPPKTMSALLETLEEKQVTIGGKDIPLPKPFITFATQNPLTIEGTEPLPKVLADRFLMKINVGYPSMEEEASMIRIKENEINVKVKKILNIEQIIELQNQIRSIEISDDVVKYITEIVDATRKDIHVVMGASPRADISFLQSSKAKAMIDGRKEVTREDIKFLAEPILSHRISVRSTGGIGVRGIIEGIIATLD